MKCSTFVNKLIKLNEHNDIDKIIVHYCGENFNPTVKRAITKNGKSKKSYIYTSVYKE